MEQDMLYAHHCTQWFMDSLPLIGPSVYGTNQANWRSWKWDFLPVCTGLRALANYCSSSVPLWQNYDSVGEWGERNISWVGGGARL